MTTTDPDAIRHAYAYKIPNFLPCFERLSLLSKTAVDNAAAYISLARNLAARLRAEADAEYFEQRAVLPIPFNPTASDCATLRNSGLFLFHAIEKTIQMYINGNDELDELYKRYSPLRPYMSTRYSNWQNFGRYDYVVSKQGVPIFIETNSAMASGYLPTAFINRFFAEMSPDCFLPQGSRALLQYDLPNALAEEVVRMENVSGSSYGDIAILVDENKKYHEVELERDALEKIGRGVVIGDVANLHRRGQEIYLGGRLVSTTFNKFRVFGSSDHWREGSLTEYRIFLDAVAKNQILSINNFAAMTISEDKGIFAALRLPSVQASLSRYEKSVVDAHTPETFLLEDGRVVTQGSEVNLLTLLYDHKDEFVLKPRSDHRASGVYSGRDFTKEEWKDVVKSKLANGDLDL